MKERPALVLSSRVDQWTDRRGVRKRHAARARLVVPLYTAEGYGAEFVERVERFEYNTHFWLPKNEHEGGKPNRDCFARFEQAGAIHEQLIRPVRFRLTDEAYEYLRAWFDYYLDGMHNEVSGMLS